MILSYWFSNSSRDGFTPICLKYLPHSSNWKLSNEFNSIGFYITDHPVSEHIDFRMGYIEGVGQLCLNCYDKIYYEPKIKEGMEWHTESINLSG